MVKLSHVVQKGIEMKEKLPMETTNVMMEQAYFGGGLVLLGQSLGLSNQGVLEAKCSLLTKLRQEHMLNA